MTTRLPLLRHSYDLLAPLAAATATLLAITGCFSDDPSDPPAITLDPPEAEQEPGCKEVRIELAPKWTCTPEQIRDATYGYPQSTGPQPSQDEAHAIALQPTTCDGLADLRRASKKLQIQRMLQENRQAVIEENCLPKYEVRYERGGEPSDYPCSPTYDGGAGGTGWGGSGGSGGGSVGGAGGGASEYSTTNTQMPRVDEADFVKNDGEFVYVLSPDGLHIIDAWPAPDAYEIAHLDLPGEPRRLYLVDNQLVVYSHLTGDSDQGSTGVPSSQPCSYGYECRYMGEGGRTRISLIDVTDRAAPSITGGYELSGGYMDSRRVGPNVYTIVHDEGLETVGVSVTLNKSSAEALESSYEARLAAADSTVDSLDAATFLPWLHELGPDGQQLSSVTACQHALAGSASLGLSFVSIVAFDLANPHVVERVVAATKPGFLYGSTAALYLAGDGVDGSDYVTPTMGVNDRTAIHKFELDGTAVTYAGSVGIPGQVLNQFSMDEYEDVLRVATTSGWNLGELSSNNVVTIGAVSGKLSVLQELRDLAPSEEIRAVRFDGDRGFVVTFPAASPAAPDPWPYADDPLFVIDLADPAAPAVLGELEIPGFSTYLQRLGPDHLLALGVDSNSTSHAEFNGVQIQIFDISDLSAPALVHKTVIPTQGAGSAAVLNHLAFNYFAPKSMLALPMTICPSASSLSPTFSGLMVFDVGVDQGVLEHGRMPFMDPTELSGGAGCGTWWTSADSLVKRSIFLDDYVIGLSDKSLRVAALSDLTAVLRSVPLQPASAP